MKGTLKDEIVVEESSRVCCPRLGLRSATKWWSPIPRDFMRIAWSRGCVLSPTLLILNFLSPHSAPRKGVFPHWKSENKHNTLSCALRPPSMNSNRGGQVEDFAWRSHGNDKEEFILSQGYREVWRRVDGIWRGEKQLGWKTRDLR